MLPDSRRFLVLPALTHSSGEVVRFLLAAGPVNQLRFLINRLVWGKGKRPFGEDETPLQVDLNRVVDRVGRRDRHTVREGRRGENPNL